MESIFIVSLLMLMGATGFAIGALFGAFLGQRYKAVAVQPA
jgi:hypothetical protein